MLAILPLEPAKAMSERDARFWAANVAVAALLVGGIRYLARSSRYRYDHQVDKQTLISTLCGAGSIGAAVAIVDRIPGAGLAGMRERTQACRPAGRHAGTRARPPARTHARTHECTNARIHTFSALDCRRTVLTFGFVGIAAGTAPLCLMTAEHRLNIEEKAACVAAGCCSLFLFAGMRLDMCSDFFCDMCLDMYLEMCLGVCCSLYLFTDMHLDMRSDMCSGTCTDRRQLLLYYNHGALAMLLQCCSGTAVQCSPLCLHI